MEGFIIMGDFLVDILISTGETSTTHKIVLAENIRNMMEKDIMMENTIFTRRGSQHLKRLTVDCSFQSRLIWMKLPSTLKSCSTSKNHFKNNWTNWYISDIIFSAYRLLKSHIWMHSCLNQDFIKFMNLVWIFCTTNFSYLFLSSIAFLESLTLAKYSAPRALMIDLDTLGRYWTAYMNGNTGLKHIHDSGRLFTIATSDNCAHLSAVILCVYKLKYYCIVW